MDLSLTKLPWYAQIGAFVVLALAGVGAFYNYYEAPMRADIAARQTQLMALRADISKGYATAKRLPTFRSRGRGARIAARHPERGPAKRKGCRRSAAPAPDGGGPVEPDDQRLQAVSSRQQAAARGMADRARARRHVSQPRHLLRSRREVHANHQHQCARGEGQGQTRAELDDYRQLHCDDLRVVQQAKTGPVPAPAKAGSPAGRGA